MLKNSLFLRSSTTVRSLAAAFYNGCNDDHNKSQKSSSQRITTCAEEPPISCIQFVPLSPAVKFPVTKRSPSRLCNDVDGDNDGDDWLSLHDLESATKKLRDLLKVEKLKRPSTDSLEHSQNLGVSVSKITQKTQIYNNCIGIIQKWLVHHRI